MSTTAGQDHLADLLALAGILGICEGHLLHRKARREKAADFAKSGSSVQSFPEEGPSPLPSQGGSWVGTMCSIGLVARARAIGPGLVREAQQVRPCFSGSKDGGHQRFPFSSFHLSSHLVPLGLGCSTDVRPSTLPRPATGTARNTVMPWPHWPISAASWPQGRCALEVSVRINVIALDSLSSRTWQSL